MRRFGLLLLCALTFPVTGRAATPRATDSQQLSQIERLTQQIRHLRPTRSVKAYFLADRAFDSQVVRNMQQLNPESDIELNQRESVLLGLLGRNDNLHAIMFGGLTSQVVGLYDYFKRALYIRKQGTQVFGVERYHIAHEYTHALQDEHYGLRRLMPDQTRSTYRNSDAASAHHALTEGDAVLTETLFIYRFYSPQELQDLSKLESQPQKQQPVPRSIERGFLFPYTAGLSFVKKLYDVGGMSGVSAAYGRLPGSTYEILHPGAYLAHWRPVPLSLHGVEGFGDWKVMDDDVFGALGYNLLLWQFLPRTSADRVTDGYRGDRYIFLENGVQNAMLLKSVWASPTLARNAKAAIVAALKKRYPGMHMSRSQMSAAEADGGVYLRAEKNRLTFAIAPSITLAQQLGTARTN